LALTDQLVSYYEMEEASGNATDSHGTNTLTDTNTVGTGTGKVGNARSFARASQEYFTIASNSDFAIASINVSFEFSCWVQIGLDTFNVKQIITKRTNQLVGTSLEYMLRIDAQTPKVYWGVDPNSFGSVSSGVTMSSSTWYFLTFGYDDSADQFFITVNAGARTNSAATTNQVVAGSNPFGIGGSAVLSDNEIHDGLIDEVGFWKGRVLTSDERTSLYNGGSGLAYPFSAGTGNRRRRFFMGVS
jgi:hypothetical protein